jgi:cobalt/nickel transport system permease protein
MHIPDGYLSPASAGTMYALAIPFWYAASRKTRKILSGRTVPLMALLSAFCFVIQMINVPLPGGTTSHAVGGSIAAIVLGPWPAVIALSVALVIQALFFGDGGLTTLGANCFNMAIVQVFVAYFLFRTLSSSAKTPRSLAFAAGLAGYVSLNVAALFGGIELGIQPLIAKAADGTPLYAPYPLSVSVPAMLIAHLIAGFAEAIVAAAAVGYLARSAPEMLSLKIETEEAAGIPYRWRQIRTLWLMVALLVFLTPIGLLAPGTTWGEWTSAQLRGLGFNFVPEGIRRWEGWWSGIFTDYSVPGLGQNTGYIVSAIAGISFIFMIFGLITLAARKSAEK